MIISGDNLGSVKETIGDASIALRIGCYDLLHEGHLEGLEFASQQADVLVVGVTADERVAERKGPDRPIHAGQTRVARVDGIEYTDYSFIMPPSFIGRLDAIRRLQPDILVEHLEHADNGFKLGLLRLLGVRCVIDEGAKVDSTTDMIRRMELSGQLAG